jgi:hypothetical protein
MILIMMERQSLCYASGRTYRKWWQQDNNQSVRYAKYSTAGMAILANFGGGKFPIAGLQKVQSILIPVILLLKWNRVVLISRDCH